MRWQPSFIKNSTDFEACRSNLFSPLEIYENLEIQKVRKLEERINGKRRFRINVKFRTYTRVTPRTLAVAEAFGLSVGEYREYKVYHDLELLIGEDDIVYITGDSGSGKSALLKAIEKELGPEAKNLDDVKIDEDKALIDTIGEDVSKGLELLSRVGLNDASLFLRKYNELSDGQKYRYRLAKLLESKSQFWIADEFCSSLDRDTAKIVAFNAQKIARQEKRCLIVATCNRDLFEDLAPTVYVVKNFLDEVQVYYFNSEGPKECSLVKEMRIVEGTSEDYKKLAKFHYRSKALVAPKKIFALKRNEETVGVIVYARPPIICFGRKKYFGRALNVKEINSKLLTITRIIIHPKYRSIGLGVKLVKETLPLAGSKYVEAIAVMARYNPFLEKAGMIKVAEKVPDKDLVKLEERLERFGLSRHLLGSFSYNLRKLKSMKRGKINKLKKILMKFHYFLLRKNILPRKVESSRAISKEEKWKIYEDKIRRMSIERLAKTLSIIARLTQVKVYLVWKNERWKND